jgi:hypothetical protein
LSPNHCAEEVFRKTSNFRQDDDWRAKRPEGYRSRVPDERQPCSCERFEAKADEHRGRDSDGSAKSGGPFEECAECKSDKEDLDAPVTR